MADPLTDVLASVRTRLQEEIEAQFRDVHDRHAEAVALARREAELEAEQRWSALLEEARSETQQRVDAAVTEARQAVEAAAAQRPVSTHDGIATLKTAFARIDAETSLGGTLTTIAQCAGELGESTLFVEADDELQPWPRHGGASHAVDEMTREALAAKAVMTSDSAVAAPLVLDGVVVAVLYGKRGEDTGRSFFDAFEALARHGAAQLANLTLLRTAQAQRWIAETSALYGGGSTADTPVEASEDETAAARRYARLLVSEIKLYNEGAVRVGRERRDLLRRLGEEIDRARRLYEERVPAAVPSRAQHFHNELVQTLAGGDPALLG